MILALIFSAIVGFLAGKFMNTRKPWYINILLGMAGGAVGDFLFGLIGFNANGLIGSLISGVVGACVVIWLARKISK